MVQWMQLNVAWELMTIVDLKSGKMIEQMLSQVCTTNATFLLVINPAIGTQNQYFSANGYAIKTVDIHFT